MAFIDNVKSKFTQAGQTTVKKAKDLSEIAKLNGAISEAGNQISSLYSKIGYEVYCAYRNRPLPEVAELIQQVSELHRKIEDCKLQIQAINASNSCPQCGAKVSVGMAFCSGCGCKLPTVEAPVAEEQSLFCSKCGKELSAGAAFCMSCGAKTGIE